MTPSVTAGSVRHTPVAEACRGTDQREHGGAQGRAQEGRAGWGAGPCAAPPPWRRGDGSGRGGAARGSSTAAAAAAGCFVLLLGPHLQQEGGVLGVRQEGGQVHRLRETSRGRDWAGERRSHAGCGPGQESGRHALRRRWAAGGAGAGPPRLPDSLCVAAKPRCGALDCHRRCQAWAQALAPSRARPAPHAQAPQRRRHPGAVQAPLFARWRDTPLLACAALQHSSRSEATAANFMVGVNSGTQARGGCQAGRAFVAAAGAEGWHGRGPN